MKRTLYLVGGPMGVGKTAVGQVLKKKLRNSVFLDGDWCWDADPFQVTEETKAMVMDNICHVLGNFLKCSAYENVIFCWVMDHQEILDDMIQRLDLSHCQVKAVSLLCSEADLRGRLNGDIEQGLRTPDVVSRSLQRLPLYEVMNTVKVNTTGKSIEETALAILQV